MELNSRGEALSLTDSKLLIRACKALLAVRRLLDGVNAFILCLGVL